MGKTIIVILAVFMVILPASSVFAVRIIDRVAAVVNSEVITLSELESAVTAEAKRRGITGAEGFGKLRREALQSLIERKLILSDARRFNIVDVTEEEVDAALESVRAGFASDEDFLHALEEEDMTLDDLRENLAEQILVRKYVDRRIRFFVRVTLDDQKKYYSEHIEDFEGKSFTEVSSKIHELLMDKYVNNKLDEYVNELRSRADVIVNVPVD